LRVRPFVPDDLAPQTVMRIAPGNQMPDTARAFVSYVRQDAIIANEQENPLEPELKGQASHSSPRRCARYSG
jgi:hypothetical protein